MKPGHPSRVRRRASPERDEGRSSAPPPRIDLFAPPSDDDAGAADPAVLSRTAILASGRAMTGRLWAEARALAGLAETYARLADRAGPPDADDWGPMGPDEAAFEAVRRKVLGLGPDQPTGSWFDPEPLGRGPDEPL